MATLVTRALTILLLTWLCGCNFPSDPAPAAPATTKEFHIVGQYANAEGIPRFEVIAAESDQEIKFAQALAKPAVGKNVEIRLENLRIIDEQANNYEITAIAFKEWVDEQWIAFTEFDSRFTRNLKKLGVVLVLDASNSLGDDFKNVKANAKEFVNLVYQNALDAALIGAVSFATHIDSLTIDMNPISGDSAKSTIIAFIDKIAPGEFTKLYDGMLTGINLLAPLNVDAKALVTFTDGRDNYSRPHHTADTVVARLKHAGIASFTIGYEGKGELDPAVLQRLALNGSYKSAKSAEALSSIFREFAFTVTDFYQISYWRNDQIIESDKPRRIRLSITARRK
jgi:Mg-chelatase subunit ChlD